MTLRRYKAASVLNILGLTLKNPNTVILSRNE